MRLTMIIEQVKISSTYVYTGPLTGRSEHQILGI